MDPTIIIDGKPYPLPTRFTLGEQAEMEKITGQGYDMQKPGALGLLALAYVAVKRVNPAITLEDIEVLTDEQLDFKGDEPEDDAVPPASDAASTASGESGKPSGENASDGYQEPTPAGTGSPD